MRDLLELIIAERTESQTRVQVKAKECSQIVEIKGLVRGPYCEFSKTLTADFTLRPNAEGAETLIVEPCYWSRQLPFWYDLQLTLRTSDVGVQEDNVPISLRRFFCDEANFRWEGKRVVLRGLKCDAPTEHDLRTARQYETTLLVEEPTSDLCEQASRLGVPLIADLRGSSTELSNTLSELSWQPAVLLVLLAEGQCGIDRGHPIYTAICVSHQSGPPTVSCDAFAVELIGDQRPPHWLATCGRPVIAIRNEGYNEIRSARADCDRLQGALAPEFNLAGYFV